MNRPKLPPGEIRQIAREAYTYGFPLVTNYATLYKQAVDATDKDYRAPFNAIGRTSGVATPDDTFVVTPNSDTPYTFLWADLRAEPVVITVPKIEAGRYYTGQLIDLYTFNFAYLGSRSYGNDGGMFLLAGPRWNGEIPPGIKAVIRSETEFAYVLFRTQLFSPEDSSNVATIQAGYDAAPLSRYQRSAPPPPPPAVSWPKPAPDMLTTPALFSYLNFVLQFCPAHPSETTLMERFATLDIGAGETFDANALSPDQQQAVRDGIADAGRDLDSVMKRINAEEISSADMFGTRDFLKNNYLHRFAGAKLGLYGNSGQEAIYLAYFVDAVGSPADASQHDYTLTFPKGQLPPARAFWSLTMYDGKSQLLVANPLKRYLLNSTTLKSYRYESDGALTLYVQKDSPGADNASNWLPAPNGPFYAILRIYMPAPEVINGTWKKPPLTPHPATLSAGSAPGALTAAEARTIARDAYVYGVPMVDQWKTMYAFSIDRSNPQYKGPFNSVLNIARVFTPDDTAFVTPNSDTPYTFIGLDLRTEPVVLTVPKMEKNRYFVFQLLDLYTFNFAYIGTRVTGNDGGTYLVAGPKWQGEAPKEISKVIRSETELLSVVGRTQLFNPADLDNVKAIQAGYKVQPLSAFAGTAAPAAAADIQWHKPLASGTDRTSPDFFDLLAFLLQFAQPPHPSEAALHQRFARLGIEPGKPFDAGTLPPHMQAAVVAGMADGQKLIDEKRASLGGKTDMLFGDREFLKNDFVARATGTQVGIGANSRDEALYPILDKDADGRPFDGNQAKYTLRFAKGALPPVNAFWSITMYNVPQQLLVKNPIDRYLINSPMLPHLMKDTDGALTLYVQADAPEQDQQNNWLPAPKGPFVMFMRYYWPKQELLDDLWRTPAVVRVPS